jgi:hypothetical protein
VGPVWERLLPPSAEGPTKAKHVWGTSMGSLWELRWERHISGLALGPSSASPQ